MLQGLNAIPLWLRLGLIFILAFLNGWLELLLLSYLQPLTSLLVTAIILAFLLNFPIHILQKRGIQRLGAVSNPLLRLYAEEK